MNTPIPLSTAFLVFGTAIVCFVLALVVKSAEVLSIGSTLLLFLAAAFALTIPVLRRLRKERLEFAWWLAKEDHAAIAGKPFKVGCFIHNSGVSHIHLDALEVIRFGSIRVLSFPAQKGFALGPGMRVYFDLECDAAAFGHQVLSGLSAQARGPLGLFAVPVYFPNALSVRILPQSSVFPESARSALREVGWDAPSRTSWVAKNAGVELRELREALPSDSMRKIAWRPSARKGKLLVRETEEEVRQHLHFVLDASPSSYEGREGGRAIDRMAEWYGFRLREAASQGSRFSLSVVSSRILSQIGSGEGAVHSKRCLDAWTRINVAVDIDLSASGFDDVVHAVGVYLRHHDGVDFSDSRSGWAVSAMAEHAQKHLRGSPFAEMPVLAESRELGILRRFCALRGLPLGVRRQMDETQRLAGIDMGIQQQSGFVRDNSEWLIATELASFRVPKQLAEALGRHRKRGLRIRVVDVERQYGHLPYEEARVLSRIHRGYREDAANELLRAGVLVTRLTKMAPKPSYAMETIA